MAPCSPNSTVTCDQASHNHGIFNLRNDSSCETIFVTVCGFFNFIQENTSDIECDIELYARGRSRNIEFKGSE